MKPLSGQEKTLLRDQCGKKVSKLPSGFTHQEIEGEATQERIVHADSTAGDSHCVGLIETIGRTSRGWYVAGLDGTVQAEAAAHKAQMAAPTSLNAVESEGLLTMKSTGKKSPVSLQAELEREVTERQQAEAALRQSEARFHHMEANFPGGMIFQFLLRPDNEVTRLGDVLAALKEKTAAGITPKT